jgi:hypothetical protein
MKRPALDLERLSHRAALVAIAAALLALPFAPARALGVALVIGVFPGLAVVASRRFSHEASLGLALALSPVIFAVIGLLALATSIHLNVAAVIAAAVGAGAFLVMGRGLAPLHRDDRTAWRGAWIVLGLAALMTFALPLADTWWRVRSDSWFHAAVADRIAREGLPAMDPYFAGFRLQYFYAYHVALAACAALARIDLFHAMILLNAIALAGCTLVFHALSARFSRHAWPRIAGLCVWLFALNGWFYLFYPIRIARALTGSTQGWSQLASFFPWSPNGHDTAMALISVAGNQFMFLDKFMIGTAFSLTFGLAAAVLLLLIEARRGEWSARHDAAFLLAILGANLLHVVTGATVAVATLLVLGLLMMARAHPERGGPTYPRLAAWVVAAAARPSPYLVSTLPRSGDGGGSVSLGIQPAGALGLLSDVLPALVLALVFVAAGRNDRDHEGIVGARLFSQMGLSATGMLVMWTLIMAAVALTVDLVTNNETKFAFLLHLPLAVLAVGGLARLHASARWRRAMPWLVASAVLPLHVLYFHHAVRDASSFDLLEGEAAAYAWIRAHTPRDAVFIEEDEQVRIPVMASRDVYVGPRAYARNWGYDPEAMLDRRRLRDDLYSDDGIDAIARLQLTVLERPVYMVYRAKEFEMAEDAERYLIHPALRGRFTAGRISVFEVDLNLEDDANLPR